MKFSDLNLGPAPQISLPDYLARRKRLAKQMNPGDVLIVATHPIHQYANDVDYPFRPNSDFWYLTGFGEPNCVLVLHGNGRSELFLQPRKAEAEIWTGKRLGIDRAKDVLGVDAAFDMETLSETLPKLIGNSAVHVIADHDPVLKAKIQKIAGPNFVKDKADARPGGPARDIPKKPGEHHARTLLHEMRLIKDSAEMKMLKKACDLGVEAHMSAAPLIHAGASEYQVEAAFAHYARHRGSNGVGYPSICGCGANAAVLHYITNLDKLRRGEVFLADMGCEWGWYTSDITRTYPVGGEFSKKQLEIYEVVLEAQQAAMKKIKPGVEMRVIHETSVQHVSDGLVDLGLLKVDKETAVRDLHYRRFFMHGTSHFLGLDVHDAGARTELDGSPRLLREGMVLTVEPGIYFNSDFTECPPGTKGIGIRIEDDIAVSGSGYRNLSKALPVDPSAVADLVRGK